jgi:hypothetical protein
MVTVENGIYPELDFYPITISSVERATFSTVSTHNRLGARSQRVVSIKIHCGFLERLDTRAITSWVA